ncbi:ABC transporter [Austwickia chelonae]|uniref:ABC transporter n=1 Tax=Austwickia chelonae TaxID=100225 RepID=UPI001F081499|nr:ABC transporter [Austwickia chelonae]
MRILRKELGSVALPLDIDGASQARKDRSELVDQLDDYILPRLADLEAPMLAVVGGSTGAGKSTLVNSLSQKTVTRTGILRPTTRACVLAHHADDENWFEGPRVLPGLDRVEGSEDHHDPGTLRLAHAPGLPRGVALLDAPDIDSVVEANRDLSRQMLAAADLWIFVTTATRYADAVPWELLRQAADHGPSVAIVLNRVPPESAVSVGDHLSGLLAREGLRSAPVFTLTESCLDEEGMLPEKQLVPLREWISRIGGSSKARGVVIRKSLNSALDALDGQAAEIAEASSAQIQTVQQLEAVAHSSYGEACRAVDASLADGSLLGGAVLAHWQDYTHSGELNRSFEAAVGRFRTRVSSALGNRPAPTAELNGALRVGVRELILSQAEKAAQAISRRWSLIPGGAQVVQSFPELEIIPADLSARAEAAVAEWQEEILLFARSEGKDRRTTARLLSFGVDAVGTVLMVAAFSPVGDTAELPHKDSAMADRSAALARKLIATLYGEQAVEHLVMQARESLAERVDALYALEEERVLSALADLQLDTGQPERVLRAVAAVKANR